MKQDENCALLGYYAVRSGNFLLTFWNNLPVLSSVMWCQPIGLTHIVGREGACSSQCNFADIP